jgi:hypothetical protein
MTSPGFASETAFCNAAIVVTSTGDSFGVVATGSVSAANDGRERNESVSNRSKETNWKGVFLCVQKIISTPSYLG